MPDGRQDLRPVVPLARTLSFNVGADRPRPDAFAFTYPMPPAPDNWISEDAWKRLQRPNVTLLTWLPRPRSDRDIVLDLGCGSAKDRDFIEAIGFRYVGCDPFSDKAPMLADGHALPFRTGSVSAVLAMQVMEHFQNPFVATTEVKRVLRPGGRFIGTVEQLVPFHMDSFYNMTGYGIFNTLSQSGLRPMCISPATNWTGIFAHYNGSYWPGVPKRLRQALARGQDAVSLALWKTRARIKRDHADVDEFWHRKFAGGFKFVAEKDDPVGPS
jgi:SAM-dependent methyltransferase